MRWDEKDDARAPQCEMEQNLFQKHIFSIIIINSIYFCSPYNDEHRTSTESYKSLGSVDLTCE